LLKKSKKNVASVTALTIEKQKATKEESLAWKKTMPRRLSSNFKLCLGRSFTPLSLPWNPLARSNYIINALSGIKKTTKESIAYLEFGPAMPSQQEWPLC
jgi:hypothetical protein